MAYITTAQLKTHIGKSKSDDDSIFDVIIDTVSSTVDRVCNREDGFFVADSSASTRTYSGDGGTVQWIDPCTSITLVEVKDAPSDDTYTSWTSDDWIAATGDPRRPDYKRTPYRFIIVSATGDYNTFTSGGYTGLRGFRREFLDHRNVPTVRITAKWGYATTVPNPIKQACLAIGAKWYKRAKSSWAMSSATPELAVLQFIRSNQAMIDGDVYMMLQGSRWIKPAVGRTY